MSPKEPRRASTRTLTLSIALSDSIWTRPLIDGRIAPDGLRLIPSVLHGSEMFWRQLRFGDFGASEMSLASLFIACARGDTRWAAVPIFTMRRFFHTGILVRVGAGIDKPADLAGKRVGVPEYQQTSAVWSRGILQEHFGVAPMDVEWHMERGADRSHGSATGFTAPRGIRLRQIASGTDIGKMLLAGARRESALSQRPQFGGPFAHRHRSHERGATAFRGSAR
jgi:4,5-dihydroxyphthalate decarboxylase